jgi:hypothetical protein
MGRGLVQALTALGKSLTRGDGFYGLVRLRGQDVLWAVPGFPRHECNLLDLLTFWPHSP